MHMRLIDVPWQQLSVSLDSGVVCRLRSAVNRDRKLLWDIWGRRRMGSGRRMEREKNNRLDLDRRRDCGNIVMEIKFWLTQLFFFFFLRDVSISWAAHYSGLKVSFTLISESWPNRKSITIQHNLDLSIWHMLTFPEWEKLTHTVLYYAIFETCSMLKMNSIIYHHLRVLHDDWHPHTLNYPKT